MLQEMLQHLLHKNYANTLLAMHFLQGWVPPVEILSSFCCIAPYRLEQMIR